ncbi:sugar ABC transporter permease [Sulfolobales archaeon HS-7]|nr:sugar ABC transporter permease [Sulfolobales archaeon HS-7]
MNDVIIILATLATTGRVLGLTLLSIVTGWLLAYQAIGSKVFENIYISVIEVFESVPVISFFPVVLLIFVTGVGGPIGTELATDFLVFTAVVWNIWVAAYQAFKTLPREMLEVVENYKFGFWGKMRNVYIPFSLPRIAANLFPSIADAFFYITVSEVFSVGTKQYSAFGIGTLITQFIQEENWGDIAFSLTVLAIVVALVMVGLREYSKYVVARYTVDTDAPIIRRGRINFRQSSRLSSVVSRNPLSKLSRYYPHVRRRRSEKEEEENPKNISKYVWIAFGSVLLILLLYGTVKVVTSTPLSLWHSLMMDTPEVLLDLGYDYVRVGIIVLISLLFSVTLGYALAVYHKLEAVMIPIIQVFSAFPSPAYFPLLFLATSPFIYAAFGPFANELYVLGLGFISTFYYVFYSFWMGVKAMPSEYWELMKNLNLNFFQKMRNIILPATFPYLISGISSTVNSAWGGLAIGEFWTDIIAGKNLYVSHGLMKLIAVATNNGNIALAAWASLIFGIVVVVYSILFTRKMMDLARKKYVAEEGLFAA